MPTLELIARIKALDAELAEAKRRLEAVRVWRDDYFGGENVEFHLDAALSDTPGKEGEG